jgi:hypothetical protein
MVALIAVGGLRLALPHELSVGPDWLLLAVIGVLTLLYGVSCEFENHRVSTFLGYLVIAIVTADMAWSLCLLVVALPTHSQEAQVAMGEDQWSPGFIDYLFLAFNTSTAFSPTDSPVLSRWAKVLMMVQSLISLTTLALLAARAVNIL